MKIIINSSPLIALSGINMLNILPKLYSEIIIPNAVFTETIIDGKDELIHNVIKNSDKFIVKHVQNKVLVEFLEDYLDNGEAEVIALSRELNIKHVIIDELKGRKVAYKHGLNVIGSLGVLLYAKKNNIIFSLKECIELLENNNIWIGKELKHLILKEANELF